MPPIPQIYRDRLASSVVGTPGVDPSGQMIGEAVAKTGASLESDVADYAIRRQQSIDEASYSKLSVMYKQASINSLEKIKQDYATNPEGSTAAFTQSLKDNAEAISKQAPNERVKLMFNKGDPWFDGHLSLYQASWAAKQRDHIDFVNIANQGNQLADSAFEVGRGSDSFVEKQQTLLALTHTAGTLTAGAHAIADPKAAAVFQSKITPTLYTRAFYGMMQSGNPAQALALTKDPGVQKLFESNPKELLSMQDMATKRMAGMVKEEKWNTQAQLLLDSPQIAKQIASGQVDYNQLDAMPDNQFTREMKRMALNDGPVQNQNEHDEAAAKFLDEAHRIGTQLESLPPGKSVSDLLKFQTDLAHARNENYITKSTYQMMLNKLVTPLSNAVIKVHDPDKFAEQQKKPWWQMWGDPNKDKPEVAIDHYNGGYNVINKWMQTIGKDQDWSTKASTIKKYMEISDSMKPEDRDALGRPYTPQSIAQKAMGIAVGDYLPSSVGPVKITNHTPEGMPITSLTKEQQDRFDRLKNLRGK